VTTIAVLATGESMSQAVADSVRHLPRVVVNDAFRLAPDALALAANDVAWWKAHPDALRFAGRKFTAQPPIRAGAVERLGKQHPLITTTTNSGLLGVHVARSIFNATRILLYGFDVRGSHYFGPHKGLTNTKPARFEEFKKQFAQYARTLPKDVAIINATPGSALECFPFLDERIVVAA
jgi:hypothetical protein